jgi:hypothetical protein
MIKILDHGCYHLYESPEQDKILIIDKKKSYRWNQKKDKGEIVSDSIKSGDPDHLLAIGKYRLYEVKNENDLSDGDHLELFIGDGKWQGYLLPLGMPNIKKTSYQILPTEEIITIVSV